jgi:hypothetical protein
VPAPHFFPRLLFPLLPTQPEALAPLQPRPSRPGAPGLRKHAQQKPSCSSRVCGTTSKSYPRVTAPGVRPRAVQIARLLASPQPRGAGSSVMRCVGVTPRTTPSPASRPGDAPTACMYSVRKARHFRQPSAGCIALVGPRSVCGQHRSSTSVQPSSSGVSPPHHQNITTMIWSETELTLVLQVFNTCKTRGTPWTMT